jgi:RNA polymerase sigma-70 factor, ECF subfamily
VTHPCGGAQVQQTAAAVARHSYGKLVAFLAARTGNVAAAEDALSEAFTAALQDWPVSGCPSNPEGWLLTVARRKLIDTARRRKNEAPGEEFDFAVETVAEASDESEIPDRRLGLMFACAHPAIDASIRAPLMLQAVLGLDAVRVASAFLMSPAAMGQRLVRAKTKIRQAGIPLRIPDPEELPSRLETVLDAIYAAFSEGWLDAAGTDAARRDLAEEAIYLCRLVTRMLPAEPEALGLLALMLYAEARRPARRSATGAYVPLAEQDTSLWDCERIAEAEAALLAASGKSVLGRYQLEAAIQSAHVARRRLGINNWAAVVQLYDGLQALTGSPVAAINRAVALAELEGPSAGLAEIDAISDPRVREYQPYWAARADLLARTGIHAEARLAYEIAIGLERDPSVRELLERRRTQLPG